MGEPAPAGRVVDQAVLAERRARRAELAEQAAARRAEDAERRLIATRAELAELESRVQWLTADREAAESRLADQQRALRQSAQRLHAEQRHREELLGEASDRAERAEADARELRARLHEVERSAARMDLQLEELRRRTAESENALAAALAARRRSEREAAEALQRLEAFQGPREQQCAEQARWLVEAERGLGLAHETIVKARRRLDELERTCEELRLEVGVERAARQAAEAQLHREAAERARLQHDAREAMDDLEQRLGGLAAELARREAEAEQDRERLGEVTASAQGALDLAERRIGESLRATAEVARQLEAERAARLAAEAEHARAQRTVIELRAELRRLRAQRPSPAEPVHPPRAANPPWLQRALALMAGDAPQDAVLLLLALLPGQGLQAPRRLEYDLDLAGAGLHGVGLAPGSPAAIEPLLGPRRDREVDFRLTLDPAALLGLMSGRGPRRRGGRVRVSATWRRRRALRRFPAATWSLAELGRAGVWVDPCLAYRALSYLIDPAWTRGHSFCIAHELTGADDRPWYVHVHDGARPVVSRTPPAASPHATVRLSRSAFQTRLDDRPPQPRGEDKPAIRGDVRSFSALARWTEWARGIGAPAPE